MTKVWRLLRGASFFATITLALFALLNLAAYIIFSTIQRKGPAVHAEEWFIPPLSPEGQEILEQAYGWRDVGRFLALHSGDPSIRSHPVLAFTEGLSTAEYRVGLEGIRYESGWEDDQVRSWLSEPHKFVYVMGGSTAFGHGVMSDQTVAAELNRLSGDVRYLNLAVQAYDSIREVDKLLSLLRRGYRPSGVVFIDGLNDVTTFAWSNYPAHDKPRTQGMLLDRGQVGLVFGFPRRRNMLAAFLFSLPVVQLAARWQSPEANAQEFSLRDPSVEAMNWPELMNLYEHWDLVQLERRSALADELAAYYRENLEFLRQLGAAFGFWVEVVYQPIGLLDQGNPFIREAFEGSAVRSIYRAVDETLRRQIQSGQLELQDCSSVLESPGESPSYVDSTHYSPRGNRLLAQCIQTHLSQHTAGHSQGKSGSR